MKKIENNSNFVVPNHLAIIMDGNGRWAKSKMLPRFMGHTEGMKNVKRIVEHSSNIGVKVLTLFAFSSENWKRPKDEVKHLMKLPVVFFDSFVPDLIKKNVKVTTIGDISKLEGKTLDSVIKAKEATKNNTGLILNFALNYGGKQEIVNAVNNIIEKKNYNNINIEDFEKYLETNFLNEFSSPDLVIRTSGETRLSNFLLWQTAYSEFYFSDKNWPDFSEKDLDEAILNFSKRERRFGNVGKK